MLQIAEGLMHTLWAIVMSFRDEAWIVRSPEARAFP
jgi:hypothetical protein